MENKETHNEEFKEEQDALKNTESAETAEEQNTPLPNEIEDEPVRKKKELEEKVKALELERDELKDKFIRKVAEFDNYKRRTEQEQQSLFRYAGEHLAVKILSIVDDLERSLQHAGDTTDSKVFTQGVQMIYEKFVKILQDQGIKRMESVGMKFDVSFHDAMMQMPSPDAPPNTVIQEVLPGYLYKDKVIRHAQVIVSAEPELEENQTNGTSEAEEVKE